MPTPKPFTELRVVRTAAWLADDLRAGTDLPVVHDLGLDVQPGARRTAWWAPHQFIARLTVTPEAQLPDLASPGPAWLATVPPELLGRAVWCGPAGALSRCRLWDDGPAFAKPAEVKVAALPAQMYPTSDAFMDALRAARLHPTSWVVVSDPLELVAEYRCFVAPRDGRASVVAASAYLFDGVTWDAWEPTSAPDPSEAVEFAQTVLARAPGPDGWVLDVGRTSAGGWVVIEANAAWSSSPYHADAHGVVAAILASQTPPVPPRWRWRSDPVFDERAVPLRIRTPVLAPHDRLPHMDKA